MGLSAASIGIKSTQVAAGGGWVYFLRYYVAGDVSPGLFPTDLLGQAELLTVTVMTPQQIVLR